MPTYNKIDMLNCCKGWHDFSDDATECRVCGCSEDEASSPSSAEALDPSPTATEIVGASNVFTFLDLSTAHVSPTSRLWLEGQALAGAVERGPSHTVAAYAEGWWVWVPQNFGDEEPLKHYRDRIPADLNAPLMLAHKLGCYYVRFDADGDVDESLPVFRDDESSLDGFPPEARAAIEAARAHPEDAGIADELAEPGELDMPYTIHDDVMMMSAKGLASVAARSGKEVVDTADFKALIAAAQGVLDETKEDGVLDNWPVMVDRLLALSEALDRVT